MVNLLPENELPNGYQATCCGNTIIEQSIETEEKGRTVQAYLIYCEDCQTKDYAYFDSDTQEYVFDTITKQSKSVSKD